MRETPAPVLTDRGRDTEGMTSMPDQYTHACPKCPTPREPRQERAQPPQGTERVCSYCQEPREPLRHQRRANYGKLICDVCTAERDRAHRRSAQFRARNRTFGAARYQSAKALLEKLKRGPCVDCGGTFIPRAMHFDHRDSATKKYNISNLASANRVKAILEEVAKCDLVCANCHAYRTERQVQAGLVKTGRPRV
jgi:hypothetical protein